MNSNSFQIRSIIIICLIFPTTFFLNACNFSLFPQDPNVIVQVVEHTQTPQVASVANVTPAASNQGSARPTPTAIPTKPAPTAKSNAPQPVASLFISNVTFSPTNIVYYGNCVSGETTQIHVEATIEPLNQIKEVLLWYELANQTGIANTGYVNMWQLGIGDYAGDIDIGQIGPNALVGWDGWADFWIEVVNKDNASMHSNAYSITIWTCAAPLPPAANLPVIDFFVGPGQVKAGDTIKLEWLVIDANCGVTLDGNFVNPSDTYSYQTFATDNGKTFSHTLYAHGEPCNSPTTETKTLNITVNTAPAGQIPNAPTNLNWSGSSGDFSENYFQFTDNSSNEDGFYIYFQGNKTNMNANQSSFTLSPPPCNENWSLYVTAYNAAGESPKSNELGIDGSCAPGPPSNLYILEWDQFGGAHLTFTVGNGYHDALVVYVNGNQYYDLNQNETAYILSVPCGETWSTYVTAWSGVYGESGPSNTVQVQGQCP